MGNKKTDFLLVVLAVLLPPLAVYLKKGVCTDFWINIVLSLIFYVPGIIHALWLILQ